MQQLQQLFDQFLRERVYVNNITPATREWYRVRLEGIQHDRP